MKYVLKSEKNKIIYLLKETNGVGHFKKVC